ncbi:MAG TPA: hypothetical protein VHZ81_00135 [Galbitalea sp.]|jgi:hypothetical protein|nr:hypothetical protein [Galbitalea sp.]
MVAAARERDTGARNEGHLHSITGNPNAKDDTALIGIVGEHPYSIEVSDPGTPGTPNTVTMAKAAAGYVVKELTP